MEAPSPEQIRAHRGDRSRVEFGKLIGVTALTVYRWELSADSPELRRPRGKVLERLLAWIGEQNGSHTPKPAPARRAEPLDPREDALLAPVLTALDGAQLEDAERNLIRLLTSELHTIAVRARASIALAKCQLLARHDTHAAFSTLVALGPEVERLPAAVQLEYHLIAAALFSHPDGQLLDVGKTHHHAALADALLGEGTGDHRFFLGYVRLSAAASLYDDALLVRGREGFAAVQELASTRLNRCLAVEAAATATLGLSNVSEAERRVAELAAAVQGTQLPLQQVRALIWQAEVLVETAGAPEQVLELTARAKEIIRRHRIAPGLHAMLMTRNEGDALARLGRGREAEAALQEALSVGAALRYMPIRIYTSLARLYVAQGRRDETKALGETCMRSDDAQKDQTRLFGKILVALAEVNERTTAKDVDELLASLQELRRLGVWPNAFRYLMLYALSLFTSSARVSHAERVLLLAERALDASPSPISSAVLGRLRGSLFLRKGRVSEARQSLEASSATLHAAGDAPQAALARWALAQVPGANVSLEDAEAELLRLDLKVPPVLQLEAAAKSVAPESGREAIDVERLVVPIQRLGTRGLGGPMLQRELLEIVLTLFPGRSVRLEELDSNGVAHELGRTGESASSDLEHFEFRDGVGRRLRLSVEGPLDSAARSTLQVVTLAAALAFEVAGLRGFSPPRPSSTEQQSPNELVLPEFIAASASMRRLKGELKRLSGSRATIILTGESGTGKEVVARAIHDLSRRAGQPYVTFNSAAVPRELFEGQLFGYRRGSFTGASSDHPGVIRAAEGGTLFLDEIGELPLDVQPKLLRFLENSEVLGLGERKPVQVDVRVIAATHRDLLQLVREGKFREDLYYRLQVIPVAIAPLRERREDIVPLARHFVRKLTPAEAEPPQLSPDAEQKLMSHRWPGNVRELRNVIERSLAFDPPPRLLTAGDIRLSG